MEIETKTIDPKPVLLKCSRCGMEKYDTHFYKNREEKATNGFDFWCKECINQFVVDFETLVKYCQINHRLFSDSLYAWCEKTADEELMRDDKFRNLKNKEEKRARRNNLVLNLYFKMMNMKAYYCYANPGESVEQIVADYVEERISEKRMESLKTMLEDEVIAGLNLEEKDWNDVWGGHFTQWELDYLNDYYDRLNKEFAISDVHMEDNFREVAKASLEKTLAYNAFKKGENGADKRWKSAVDMFISLSDQAKLSSSKRTKDNTTNEDSLGEIIRHIEYTGALMKKQVFEKDDVDLIIEDFKHTFRSFTPSDIALPESDGDVVV